MKLCCPALISAVYHRHKGQIGNVKYYTLSTKQEVIFDKNGKQITTPENIGTLNYGPDPWQPAHGFI